MAELNISAERAEQLAVRNPAPEARAAERAQGTVGVPAVQDGDPEKKPEKTETTDSDLLKQTEELRGKLEQLGKRNEELVDAAKKKDKAIEDLRVRKTEEPQAVPEQPLDEKIDARIVQEAKRQAELQRKDLEGLLQEGREAKKEKDRLAAVKDFDEETVRKYETQAEEFRKLHPTLNLTQAINQLVPRKEPQTTAPGTNVEPSRGPAPQGEKSVAEQIKELNAQSAQAAGQGKPVLATKLAEQAMKLRLFKGT